MAQKFDLDTTGSFFTVPQSAAEYLTEASENQLRVLLALLSGTCRSEAELGEKLGLSAQAASAAVAFWYERGVFVLQGGYLRPAACGKQQKVTKKPSRPVRPPEYSMEEIARAAEKNTELASLLKLTQEKLGTALNPTDTRLLYSFCEYYGMEPAAVLVLVNYHASCGKKSIRQIEKTVAHLDDCGVLSLEGVTDYVASREARDSYEGMVRRLFGIGSRAFTQKESKLLAAWQETYGADEALLREAYEKTVDATGKASLPYADKILRRWSEEGKDTVEKTRAEKAPAKKKRGVTSGIDAADYQHWAFANLTDIIGEEDGK